MIAGCVLRGLSIRSARRACLALTLLLTPVALAGQTAGSIVGRVTAAEDSSGLAGVTVSVRGHELTAVTDSAGRFVIASVPAGERTILAERIGFRSLDLSGVLVSLGRPTSVDLVMEALPVAVPGVEVEVQRVRLVEPDVSATREILVGRELRALPVDRVADAVELAPGVSGGHFRGGRIGQETHIVDGLEVKNQLEASAHGPGIELPAGALDEIEVITGGLPASYGSALSGVVSYVTRRGSTERWDGRASVVTDQWAPDPLFRGFTEFNLAAGGPLRFLGPRASVYVDVVGQGMADADPRERGLDCLREADATPAVAALISQVRSATPELYCPYTGRTLPHQEGDKAIGFVRLDVPAARGVHLTFTALGNRLQRLLYTPELKYSSGAQLGQRSNGGMFTGGVDFNGQGAGRASHVSMRIGYVQLDRYLGAVDPVSIGRRSAAAGFGWAGFDFLGEDEVRSPIEGQIEQLSPVPGYAPPSGIDSPFGPAGAGLFQTAGTPDIANWTRSQTVSADVVAEFIGTSGGQVRMGASARHHQVESYERTAPYLAGSLPAYARFHPAALAAFIEGRLAGDDELNLNVGLRLEAFRSGVRFRQDRDDFLSPAIDASWQLALMPRFGIALPLPGTDGRTALRLSYGHVAQAPDYRFFLDTAIGDSIRRSVSRQGNPALSFERGRAYEMAASQLLGPHMGLTLTGFRKDLRALASGNTEIGTSGRPQYSVNDFGTVQGVEVSLRGHWEKLSARLAYTLQKATGASSGNDSDTTLTVGTDVSERPLAFDQRHAFDLGLFLGSASGASDMHWSAALTGSAQSGFPLDRQAAAGDTVLEAGAYMPWTAVVDLRLAAELGRVPGCDRCSWRIVADARNLPGRTNVLALDAGSGRLAPSAAAIQAAIAGGPRPAGPIPSESPLYRASIDTDRDGTITLAEYDAARLAAVIDRYDPSLRIGEARSVRLGLEIAF